MQSLNDNDLLDMAFQIFLEMAPENLANADIDRFNQNFAQYGEIALFDTAENWDEEIGVLIDPDKFVEVWIGLAEPQNTDEMSYLFAKCLIERPPFVGEQPEFHMIWQ